MKTTNVPIVAMIAVCRAGEIVSIYPTLATPKTHLALELGLLCRDGRLDRRQRREPFNVGRRARCCAHLVVSDPFYNILVLYDL